MTEQTTPGFSLEHEIRLGDDVAFPAGARISVRRPKAGELRGVDITALVSRCDYAQIEALAPRVTMPVLHKQHIAAMDPSDLVALGGELVDFLVPMAARPGPSPAA